MVTEPSGTGEDGGDKRREPRRRRSGYFSFSEFIGL